MEEDGNDEASQTRRDGRVPPGWVTAIVEAVRERECGRREKRVDEKIPLFLMVWPAFPTTVFDGQILKSSAKVFLGRRE